MSRASRTLVASTSVILAAIHTSPALSQTSQPQPQAAAEQTSGPRGRELQITITANRSETAIQRTGSAITVVSGEEIRKTNPGSLLNALRFVPGLDATETGGPGGSTTVRLRGANGAHTLVLVDGVRVNDPSGASGEFDFANLAPGLIDRIEVLSGPQSALYGSDAMGGVINIITKRGRGPLKTYGQVEGGSYGTIGGNAGAYGSNGPWNYALATSSFKTDGFSRYGYRVGRAPNVSGPLEADGLIRHGAYGRIGYNPGTGFRFEIGSMATWNRSEYDAAFSATPDSASKLSSVFHSSFAKAELDMLEGRLKNSIQLFSSRTDRHYRDISSFGRSKSEFIGTRHGVEYQGTLGLNQFGSLIFGARFDREAIDTYSQAIAPVAAARKKDIGTTQDTRSLFSLWQVPIGERFDVSFAGRIDSVAGGSTYATWRTTAAYRITETGTKLRASLGTGAKSPTLYQRFGGYQGARALEAERNTGGDIGIDQTLWNGRAKVSLTGFYSRFKNLIAFQVDPTCLPVPLQAFGCYVNIARAETSGLEAAADLVLIEEYVSLKGAYTFLRAKDLANNKTLARRPDHAAKFGLTITPTANWTIEPSLTFVSRRYNAPNERQRLAAYARFDTLVSYRVNDNVDVYVRGENLTNARYQDAFNYGTTGRAVYAGMKTTW